MDAAVVLGRATGADLQVYDPDVGVLRMAAQRGFSREFLAYFATVDAAGPTACAKALASIPGAVVELRSRLPVLIIGDAVAWDYLTFNPAEHASLPRERRRRQTPQPWTVDELSRWLRVAMADRFAGRTRTR